uniref:Uncharacterized protein n=1 Tax=viral metagenome TaxID=1070528 RepID=A0A6M3KPI8_9ZZZZ
MIIICMVVAILFIYWIGYQHGRGVREELIRETERIIRRQGLEDKHKITALKSIWRINKEG